MDDRAVVAERRWLAIEVVFDVAQVLTACVRERHASANHPRQDAHTSLVENVAQPVLRRALRVPTCARPAAFRPSRPDRPMDLTPIRQPILGPPDRAAGAFEAVDVSRDRAHVGT